MQIFGPQLQGYNVKQPDIATPADLVQAQGIQGQNALRGIQVQQGQRELDNQNALRSLLSSPGAIGQDGMPTANALSQAMGIDPKAGLGLVTAVNALNQKKALQLQEQQHAALFAQQVEAARQKRLEGLMEHRNDVIASGLAYGPEGDRQQAISTMVEKATEAGKAGLLGNDAEVQQFISSLSGYDYAKYAAKMNTIKAEQAMKLAQQKEDAKPERYDYYTADNDPSGLMLRIDRRGGKIEAKDSKATDWGDYGGTWQPNFRPVNAPSAQQKGAAAGAVVEAQQGVSGAPTEATKQMDAWRYITDGTMPPNMGRGVQGAAQATAIRNEASRIAKEDLKMEPEEIRMAQLTNKAQMAAIGKLGQVRAAVLQSEKLASYNSELALEASEDATRSGVPLLNKGIQWAQENLKGDPFLRRFTAANETFISEYARVMGGGYGAAQTTEGAQARAHTLINRAATKEEYRAAVDQLRKEMDNRVRSLNDQMSEERGRLRGSITNTTPPESKSSTPAAPALPANDYSKLWK